ncbi:MAG TPA: serine hydrolase [Steroidobacteraceae bacterium]|nr:serine hydrolase [Steroidobacteraceae bacterium]
MSITSKVLFAAIGGASLAAAALWARPPELFRVGANYAAKIVCSNVFLAHRDPAEILRSDVQAPGNPLLELMRVRVDRGRGIVRAGLFGFIGGGLAVDRPGSGCTVLPDGKLAGIDRMPRGRAIASGAIASRAIAKRPDPGLDRILDDAALAGPGMRAIVVMQHGRVVGERYGRGFDASTPLLGWSMTKSVVAGLIGLLVEDGRLTLDQSAGWPAAVGDPRAAIRIADLLSMTSGLHFNEDYGDVSDVTRMLFLEPDMAAFARAQPLEHPVGTVWSYASGTAVILSRIFQDAVGPGAQRFVRERLFDPLGMHGATIETDARGTLVGSSYMYATARDWARYAELLLQDGVWRGERLLPQGYVAMMASPVAASGGQYGRGLLWRFGSSPAAPGVDPDRAFGIPADTFWMEGHDGQSIAIVPSRTLVVLRMGLTPARDNYQPQPLVHALLEALRS